MEEAPARHPGLRDGPIYLDYNASTPVDPRVVDAMEPYLRRHFGNPSNTHHYGAVARRAISSACENVAELICATSAEIVFTGSGSEADALAIRGTALADPGKSTHIVTQETEHPAVLETARSLQKLHGTRVTVLPVDSYGRVDPSAVADAISPDTVLVSIMSANNETGTIQPLEAIAEVAHRHGVLVHTDAAQTVGKIPVDVRRLGVDLLTVVGHKMYAPKGIGALWVRDGVRLEPVAYGGGQEQGLRAGTESVPLIVALGAAAEIAAHALTTGEPGRIRILRDDLHRRLAIHLPGRVRLNGHPTERLPNTVNLSIAGVSGHELLAAAHGIAASTGSACHTHDAHSPGLAATSGSDTAGTGRHDRTHAPVRLSLGRWTTTDDTARAAQTIAAATERLTHATR